MLFDDYGAGVGNASAVDHRCDRMDASPHSYGLTGNRISPDGMMYDETYKQRGVLQ